MPLVGLIPARALHQLSQRTGVGVSTGVASLVPPRHRWGDSSLSEGYPEPLLVFTRERKAARQEERCTRVWRLKQNLSFVIIPLKGKVAPGLYGRDPFVRLADCNPYI